MYEEEAEAFESLGLCYTRIAEYTKAIWMFKSLLEIAWIHKDIKLEICAYDNLSLAYYYNGDLSTSEYYYHRSFNSIIEPMESHYRRIPLILEKKYRKQIELEKRGISIPKIITLRPYPVAATTEKALQDDISMRIHICKAEGATPRVLPDDPWKPEGGKSLPSPRSQSHYTIGMFTSDVNAHMEKMKKDKDKIVCLLKFRISNILKP